LDASRSAAKFVNLRENQEATPAAIRSIVERTCTNFDEVNQNRVSSSWDIAVA
jgi:hypothetical protein